MKLLLCALFFTMIVNVAFSQEIVLEGKQYKGIGENAILWSKPVKITRTKVIYDFSGNNNGFWITKNGLDYKPFWSLKFAQENAKGQKLTPGTYRVYPNLKQGCDSACVKLILK